jgi:hypothetical protein
MMKTVILFLIFIFSSVLMLRSAKKERRDFIQQKSVSLQRYLTIYTA